LLEDQTIRRLAKNLLADIWSLNPFRENQFRNHFTIMHYHHPEPDHLETQIKYLKQAFNVLPLSYLRDHYVDGVELPEKALFVTFDDGWKSNYNLLPVVEKHDFPITIFLSTGLVGTDRKPGRKVIYDDFRKDEDLLKTIIGEKTQRSYEIPYDQRIMLNVDEIKEMSRFIDFQSHGVNHHVSPAIPTELMDYELRESKRFICELTGNEVYAFAFPYNEVSSGAYSLLEKNGYTLARAGTRRYNKLGVNPYKLNSIGADAEWSIKQLKRVLRLAEMKTVVS